MVNRDTLLLACGTRDSRSALCHIFENNYHLLEASSIRQARLLLKQNHGCIAAILLDASAFDSTDLDGLSSITKSSRLPRIPVLVITSSTSASVHQRIFDLGAADVTVTPYSPTILQHRLQTLTDLHLHRLHLESLVDEQAKALQQSNETLVGALSSIIEYRNAESGQHVLRIRHFTQILLNEVARSFPEYALDEGAIQLITSASSLHDIGKISIPDSILTKPGRLTPEENAIMQTHTLVGCRILESLSGSTSQEYLRYAYEICRYHHERWDGSGYPEGICGDEIPISAQVVGLADAYDALTSKRVYKDAFSQEQSSYMILSGECGAFSPKLLECFQRVNDEFSRLAQQYADGCSPENDSAAPRLNLLADNDLEPLRLTQAKYHSLLHYLDVTTLELDFDQGTYHLIYNPDPNLSLLSDTASLDQLFQTIATDLAIPEDTDYLLDVIHHDIPSFFHNGLRCQHAYFHIKNLMGDTPLLYQMTLLRVDPPDSSRRRMIILWQKEPTHATARRSKSLGQNFLDFAVLGTLDALYSVHNDRWLTLNHLSRDLLSQLGYTRNELISRFQNQMIRLIHPDDRQRILASISEQLTKGIEFMVELRLLHKNGHYIWMLNKGRLFRKHNGQEYLYSLLVDISKSKAAEEELQQTLDRQAIILSQAENVIFECDMDGTTATFTEKWEEIFGYPPMTRNISERIHRDSHFHPDDIPLVLATFRALQNGASYQEIELRVAKADGCYLWCQARITVQYDREGKPLKLVGVIVNIDEKKRAAQELQHRADRDALTNLLNKGAGKLSAEKHLASAGAEDSAALLIIDLDNFKQVNDQYGHLLGDIILSQAASEIEHLFRTEDIIARIGGDEFLVLMKNTPSLSLLHQRLDALVSVFRTTLHDRVPEADLGCSVGVSLFPQHGTTYEDLFRRADQALYQVKDHGKRGYLIYDADSPAFRARPKQTAVTTSIDSDSHTFTVDHLIQYTFTQLYTSGDIEATINNILALVGQRLHVSRVYIFENDMDNRSCSNTFEWCNEGIAPAIHCLQNLSYETDLLGYEKNFNDQGIFYCPDVTILPKAQFDLLDPQGVRSMLQCSIRDNGVFRGFVGFDECSANRLWTQRQIDMLTFFSEILSVFLLKKRVQEETNRRAANLSSVLERQHAWIYVVNPETYEIAFLNENLKKAVPNAKVGHLCYQCLMNLTQPCPECPISSLRQDGHHELLIRHPTPQLRVLVEGSLIQWNGKDACLMTCRDIKMPKLSAADFSDLSSESPPILKGD